MLRRWGDQVRTIKLKLTVVGLCASALAAAVPADAQLSASPALPGGNASALPAASSVAAFYDTWRARPIWFKGPASAAAVNQLIAILQRAPFDGYAAGPQSAQLVQAAVAQAQSGRPADVAAADRVLSTAWVQYVQALKRQTPNMIYAYPVLAPQGTRADQILLTASAAPSLERHLVSVAALNPTYAQLRDTAWAEAQASGKLAPDPRLIANLDRARSLPAAGRFMIVDSATQRLTLYDNGQPVDSMKVIVGTPELPTPLIASVMYYVTFNPYWNAPHHLVRKAIAPNVLSQGMGYLKSRGYEVMADWTTTSAALGPDTVDWKAVAAGKTQIRVRQKPGTQNFMGILKFPFPNPEDIYLHDTPNKALFAKASRDLSNGCVRVEDARRLGQWLLGREPVPPGPEAEIRVQMPKGVPVYLTYLTAQARDGKITYLRDIYGWDPKPAQLAAAR
jgi:murein L,D-transpeptidase YcbB/YkuD